MYQYLFSNAYPLWYSYFKIIHNYTLEGVKFKIILIIYLKGYNIASIYVIFVDFGYGDQDILANSRIFLKVIEEVFARATGHVTVSGYSMEGLIARFALQCSPALRRFTRRVTIPCDCSKRNRCVCRG
jgi:hypothetical protein